MTLTASRRKKCLEGSEPERPRASRGKLRSKYLSQFPGQFPPAQAILNEKRISKGT